MLYGSFFLMDMRDQHGSLWATTRGQIVFDHWLKNTDLLSEDFGSYTKLTRSSKLLLNLVQ